jgi:hypothetical protein
MDTSKQTTWRNEMTKSQSKQIEIIRKHAVLGNTYAVAAGLSGLIRSAMRQKDIDEMLAVAVELKVRNHPDFII